MKYYVLFNPLSANGQGKEKVDHLAEKLPEATLEYIDVTKLLNYVDFFAQVPQDAQIILCGGDGTLNRFVNDTRNLEIKHKILYYPCGSGNDFAREVKGEGDFIALNEYITNLPVATVKGKEYLVLNGVGYGIDGYCCEVGDEICAKHPKKKINYAGIAIKGLLFHYKPTNATVIVDGVEHSYKKVWLAPMMNGLYYGGGMMPTPEQNRKDAQNKLSVMVFHGSGKLKTLCIFPSIFKGEHVKHSKYVTILSGNEITVQFDELRAVQVDGETILGVKECTVKKGK